MVTQKLTAIGRIITASNFSLTTVYPEAVKTLTVGKHDLEGAMLMAVSLKATYEDVMRQITEQAADGGELKTLQALRETLDKVEVPK